MSVKDDWDRLDSETRTWLLENPASLVLPHAMSVRLRKDARCAFSYDPHGQIVLSRDDHEFIREKAEAAGTIRIPEREYRFFDTAPLPVIGQTTPGIPATASPDDASNLRGGTGNGNEVEREVADEPTASRDLG
ncbi:hypothetical protein AB6813_12795 [bacterium RCC_150]